ncbi:MAG: hypothetical protein ACRD28_11415 [Acidobacteriaceae bacterium]
MKMSSVCRKAVGAAMAIETELLWRAAKPEYECGPDAVTHNKWLPPQFGGHA